MQLLLKICNLCAICNFCMFAICTFYIFCTSCIICICCIFAILRIFKFAFSVFCILSNICTNASLTILIGKGQIIPISTRSSVSQPVTDMDKLWSDLGRIKKHESSKVQVASLLLQAVPWGRWRSFRGRACLSWPSAPRTSMCRKPLSRWCWTKTLSGIYFSFSGSEDSDDLEREPGLIGWCLISYS